MNDDGHDHLAHGCEVFYIDWKYSSISPHKAVRPARRILRGKKRKLEFSDMISYLIFTAF